MTLLSFRALARNLGVILPLLVFLLSAQSIFAFTTSRLTLPVSTNATLIISTTDSTVEKKVIVSDHLSSTRVVLTEDGTKSSDIEYYPYGAEKGSITGSSNDRYYTGQKKVSENSPLYNYNARFYNPTLGVFTQPDTVEGPNRFAYVGGNPIMSNDPSGHMACPQCQDRFSANPVEADPIPDPLTYIKVLAKYAGLYDIGIIGNMAFDTVTGIGYREDNDPIAAASAKLDRYISKSDAGNAEVAGMMQPMSVVGGVGKASSSLPHVNFVDIAFQEALDTTFAGSGGKVDAAVIGGKRLAVKVMREFLETGTLEPHGTQYIAQEIENAQILARMEIGPAVHARVINSQGETVGYAMDIVPGDFRELVPSSYASTRSITELNDAVIKIMGEGYDIGDFQYFLKPDGGISIIDAGGMRPIGAFGDGPPILMQHLAGETEALGKMIQSQPKPGLFKRIFK